MIKVDYFSVEVKYTGSFESYTKEDWKAKAIAKVDGGVDAYDKTAECDSLELAKEIESEFDYVVDNTFPCNRIATVKWAFIREEDE